MEKESAQPNWTFRCSFSPLFSVMAFWISMISLAITVGTVSGAINASLLLFYLGALVAVLLVMAVIVAVWITYMTYEMNAFRIRGDTFWGWYFDLEWNQISAVRVFKSGGLRFLGLRSQALRKEMVIPLFLTDMRHFFSLAMELSEPDNPLHQFARAWLKVAVRPAETVAIHYHYH